MKFASCLKTALIVLSAVTLAYGDGDKPKDGDKPATDSTRPKPKAGETPPVIQEAIKELGTEFETALKDPSGIIRDKSDYFAKSTEVFDQADIIATLDKRLHKDQRVDAYIKWQVISAQKGIFDEVHAKAAIKLYNKAPAPAPRPGTSPQDQANLINQIKGMKPEQIDAANAKWQETITAHMKAYGPMLAYRDELYARLPRNHETLRMGYEDANDRISRGYDAAPLVKRISNDLRQLAAGLKPVEIGKLAVLVQTNSGKQGAKIAKGIIADKKTKEPVWEMVPLVIDKRGSDALYKDLVEMSKAGF